MEKREEDLPRHYRTRAPAATPSAVAFPFPFRPWSAARRIASHLGSGRLRGARSRPGPAFNARRGSSLLLQSCCAGGGRRRSRRRGSEPDAPRVPACPKPRGRVAIHPLPRRGISQSPPRPVPTPTIDRFSLSRLPPPFLSSLSHHLSPASAEKNRESSTSIKQLCRVERERGVEVRRSQRP